MGTSLIEAAVSAYNEGNTEAVFNYCLTILKLVPEDFNALHLLGLVSMRQGADEQAESYLKRARERGKKIPEVHFNLGTFYLQRTNFPAAAECFRQATRLRPNWEEAWFQLGNSLSALQQHAPAATAFQRVISLHPGYASAHYNLGNCHMALAQQAQAVRSFEQALSLDPNHVGARKNLAIIALEQGQHLAAIAQAKHLIEAGQGSADIWCLLGRAQMAAGQLEQAETSLIQAVASFPDDYKLLQTLGSLYAEQGRNPEALAIYVRALKLAPDDGSRGEILANLGILSQQEGNIPLALAYGQEAVSLAPNNSACWNGWGATLLACKRAEEAVSAYQRAVALDSENAEAHANLARALLLTGDYDAGWQEYEWGSFAGQRLPNRGLPQPRWDGGHLASGTLLICGEQGVGDEVMFASLLRLVAGKVSSCLVECDPRLIPLFSRSFPTMRFVARSEAPAPELFGDDIVAYIPLGRLPLVLAQDPFRTSLATPYLQADPEKIQGWRQRVSSLGRGPVFGVSWRGGGTPQVRRQRSLDLANLAPTLKHLGAQCVDLQYGQNDEERQQVEKDTGLVLQRWPDFDPGNDLDDMAALLGCLDGLISVDNANVHLAGALGVPTWVLLPVPHDWRWGVASAASPWYASVKLLRQSTYGDWPSVLAQLEGILQ